jgi:hypothetical protein
MKRTLLISMLLVIMLPFLALANEYEIKGKAGNYIVEVRIDKNPPDRGNNNMSIYIKDRAFKPVTEAHVEVQYLMPSFPGKPPMMEYKTVAKLSGNHYLAQIDLSMAGEWTVILGVTRVGKTETMQFSFVVK